MFNDSQIILNKEKEKNPKKKLSIQIRKSLNINKRNIINIVFLFIIIYLLTQVLHLKQQLKNNEEKKNTLNELIKKSNNQIKITERKFDEFLNGRTNIYAYFQTILESEKFLPQLKLINKKRSFDKKLPLPKEINCKPHLIGKELYAFVSLLTKNTTFFETGSGCSSLIAKYYAKKTYAIEGDIKYYELGIKNGLKEILIFKDLKPTRPDWSFPGNDTNIEDWKKYFQSYKKEYNADVILIDGRFKVATAFDIFNKIRNDTIILLHEYDSRPFYYIIEKYYKYIYHWDSLFAFIKNDKIKEIPLTIQKKYWSDYR